MSLLICIMLSIILNYVVGITVFVLIKEENKCDKPYRWAKELPHYIAPIIIPHFWPYVVFMYIKKNK